jgi:hypothetical protein
MEGNMVAKVLPPRCSRCNKAFQLGATWHGANYCRAAFLLAVIAANPGLSTWELSQVSGIAYQDASRALLRAREAGAVDLTVEEREQGGTRYRYVVSVEWEDVIARWDAQGLL